MKTHWFFVQNALRYLEVASQCTPEGLRRHCRESYDLNLRQLPLDSVFEPLRGPVQHIQLISWTTHKKPTGIVREAGDVFAIPDDNVFFLDILQGHVLSAAELRDRYFRDLWGTYVRSYPTAPILVQPPNERQQDKVFAWMIVDAHSHECRALLHLSRSSQVPNTGYITQLFFSCLQKKK